MIHKIPIIVQPDGLYIDLARLSCVVGPEVADPGEWDENSGEDAGDDADKDPFAIQERELQFASEQVGNIFGVTLDEISDLDDETRSKALSSTAGRLRICFTRLVAEETARDESSSWTDEHANISAAVRGGEVVVILGKLSAELLLDSLTHGQIPPWERGRISRADASKLRDPMDPVTKYSTGIPEEVEDAG